jgi:sugar phosphate isomerase/epimerase
MMTRRGFLKGTAAGLVGTAVASKGLAADAGGAVPRIRLSACDWSLGAGGPGGLEVAKRCTLDGLEVSPGGPADRLQIADPAWRAKLKEAAAKTGVAVSSVAMGLLNECPLASDPRGPAWLEQVIEATADLGARAILLAFFGPGDLLEGTELKAKEADVVVGRLKDAAPKAKQAGVILGVESYLSAAQNLDLLKRIGSDSVRVYYDVRNSTDKGYDVPAEIRTLGDRICQVHFKDGEHYLGEGKVDMDGVAASMAAIGYAGWVVLETSCPSKDRDADFTRNAAYARKLLKIPAK